ncbi:hypothetical protein CC2G_002465 [Coprinopsis cinerea AmutBmut pab1-1]|nr:hypothetical protein CC2G_002465 [Coprinopsis cinerea AmutBmut pab1-1]
MVPAAPCSQNPSTAAFAFPVRLDALRLYRTRNQGGAAPEKLCIPVVVLYLGHRRIGPHGDLFLLNISFDISKAQPDEPPMGEPCLLGKDPLSYAIWKAQERRYERIST